ncbi:MAG: IS66 family transposase [Deltaproteobacteria bacterium]|nr:IS66 family transposase [Deltaproteobacteria bacterium]
MKPQQALAIYKAGQDVVVKTLCDMDAKIKSQEITIAKLSKNSSNSGKRPSSDDITKPKSKNKDGNKRKIGGQPGHPRHERPLFPEELINDFHDHELDRCPICNGNVIFVDAEPRIIQQVELKEVFITTEEHRSYPCWCEVCQKIHYASFPPEVVKQGLFKPRITALVAYMSNVCHASFSTMRKFFRDIFPIKISRGYLSKVIQKVSMSLEKPYEELLDRLPLETTLNVDETGHKENGDKFWTWVFKAELYVLFRIDKSRGSEVLIDVLGKEFNGVLGCDYFSAYRKYMKNFDVSIQFCIAHLIRDIKFLAGLPDAETKAYGQKLLQNVKDMFKIIHERENLTQEQFNTSLEQAKGKIITVAIEDAPSYIDENGKEEKREAQNMANRFRKHGKEYFTFITTPGIGPTNNLAEQAIRFVVIDRHITQGTRSIKGRKASERLWTVIATCSLQGRSAFDFILKAVTSYFNGQAPPSLLPEPADTS